MHSIRCPHSQKGKSIIVYISRGSNAFELYTTLANTITTDISLLKSYVTRVIWDRLVIGIQNDTFAATSIRIRHFSNIWMFHKKLLVSQKIVYTVWMANYCKMLQQVEGLYCLWICNDSVNKFRKYTKQLLISSKANTDIQFVSPRLDDLHSGSVKLTCKTLRSGHTVGTHKTSSKLGKDRRSLMVGVGWIENCSNTNRYLAVIPITILVEAWRWRP